MTQATRQLARQLARTNFLAAKSFIHQAHNLLASAEGKSEEWAVQREKAAAGCRVRARQALTLALEFLAKVA